MGQSGAPGELLGGRYRLERVLGQGGIGVVWEAVNPATGERVAIKMIRPELAARDDIRRRLAREAKAAAAVSHPNLVRIHEVISTPGGAPALVMELLEGESLEARLSRQGALSLPETAWTLLPALTVLRAMHHQGIVHRDLKPANIFLARSGSEVQVKLLDFGLVKWVDPSRSPGLSESLTASGVQVGTPFYMAPEQVLGESSVDRRADVFAAGVVLYECLTGARPTEAATRAQVFRRVLEGSFESLAAKAPSVPAELAALVDRMLSREPEQRPAELDPAIELLGRYAGRATPIDVPIRIRRPRRLWMASGAAGGAAFVALLVVLGLPSRAPVQLTGMVYVPGGRFTMGQTPEAVAQECRELGPVCSPELLEREQPARAIQVSPFFIDEVEVSNEEFARFLNVDTLRVRVVDDDVLPNPQKDRWVTDAAGARLLDLRSPSNKDVHEPQGVRYAPEQGRRHFHAVPGKERWPVVQVTWDGARAFCESRGKRLPTEAEWELTAGGPGTRRFPWGDQPASCESVVFGRYEQGPCATLPRHPEPAGAAAQDVTPDGVRGLGGNVSEWVADWFGQGIYGACRTPGCLDERVDPPPAASDPDPFMLVRGSSFLSDRFLRTTRRVRWHRRSQSPTIGFRCAMSAPER